MGGSHLLAFNILCAIELNRIFFVITFCLSSQNA